MNSSLDSGKDLVFLCSMPRSGSTMLSMILSSHEDILSPPEPWILLSIADFFGAKCLSGIPYGRDLAIVSSTQFLDDCFNAESSQWFESLNVPNYENSDLAQIVSRLANMIYTRKLEISQKSLLIDKTPRYYWILDLLDAAFPYAKKIFLKRNPLDIAASYKTTWGVSIDELTGQNVTANTLDFSYGLYKLESYFSEDSPLKHIVSYENMVLDPEGSTKSLCTFLEVEYNQNLLNYFLHDKVKQDFSKATIGDGRASKTPSRIDSLSIGKWKNDLSEEEQQSLVAMLGPSIFEKLGYEYVLKEMSLQGIYIPTDAGATHVRSKIVDGFFSLDSVKANQESAFNAKHNATSHDYVVQLYHFYAHFIHQLYSDIEVLRATNQELSSANESLEADREAKAEVVERLSVELTAVTSDRAALRHVNQELASANESLEADREAKAEVVERLSVELAAVTSDRAALRQVNQELASANESLEADREAKAEVVERLSAELSKAANENDLLVSVIQGLSAEAKTLSTSLVIQASKVLAKDEVIRNFSGSELERKTLLGGVPDVALYWRRKYPKPGYGEFQTFGIQSKGLHIAVDALEIVFGVSGGVETYMKMLVRALIESSCRVTIICLPDQVAALKRQFQDQVNYFVVRVSRAMDLSIKISNRFPKKNTRISASTSMATFSRLVEDIGADVLHSPVQIFSCLDFRLPAVLNLHDLQHLHFPENFRPSDIEARNYLYGLSANLADAVIVSSDFVGDDLVSKLNIPRSKVFMVPVTWDPMVERGLDLFSAEQASLHYKLPPTYALYPAQFWPHKNHVRLVEALRIVRDQAPESDLKLVFTGYRGHSGWPAVEEAIRHNELQNDVLCLDHVPVEHLAALYKGALFCVMPSTFEASSYPVIEAQILGCPAMCSNVTSLPELMRDGAGLLFDPFSPEDIAEKMTRWINDSADREAHALRALQKARREHSLQNYIDGVSKVYKYVIKEGH